VGGGFPLRSPSWVYNWANEVNPMGIDLRIPDSVTQAIRLPTAERQPRLMLELAVTLYAQGILSFGKARELAGLSKYDLGLIP